MADIGLKRNSIVVYILLVFNQKGGLGSAQPPIITRAFE